MIVNYTNCVQCGAITAKGGRLTPPEGGDGPLYTRYLTSVVAAASGFLRDFSLRELFGSK